MGLNKPIEQNETIYYTRWNNMSRPQKCRKVCRLPDVSEFLPVGNNKAGHMVILSVDEYETIRLIDKQGFSQEECSAYMMVARTTVQQIYTSARQKIALSLVDGLPLKIKGGHYSLCDGTEQSCNCGGCRKHRQCE